MSNYTKRPRGNSKASARKNDCKEYKVKRKGSRSGSTSEYGLDRDKATNDPAWYGSDSALLRDAASLPFSAAVGTKLSLHNPALDVLSTQEFTVPGLQVMYVAPSVGWSADPSSPLNAATFRVYTFVRHQNSGHANYDAPDLMLYLLAMSQVYSYINFLQRAYGISTTFAQKNRYIPDAILRSMGVDYTDVRNNLAAFRYGINMLINKAASLCVPADMPIFNRYASIYQNVYIEGDSIKDQLYYYAPYSFWGYALHGVDSAGMLEPLAWGGANAHTVEEMLDFGNNMLARLIQSEDMNIMSGDILKAYGSDKIIKLVNLPTDFPIIPIKDHAVLNQMKNTTVLRDIDFASLYVTQDPTHGWLEHKPSLKLTGEDSYQTHAQTYLLQGYTEDRLLTVKSVDPTPEEVMEYTRGMVIANNFKRDDSGNEATAELKTGADIVTLVRYIYFDVEDDVATYATREASYLSYVDASNPDSIANVVTTLGASSNFRYHPMNRLMLYKQGGAAGSFNITQAQSHFDLDNYTVVTTATLERMHETAMLSMLNVPSLVKV